METIILLVQIIYINGATNQQVQIEQSFEYWNSLGTKQYVVTYLPDKHMTLDNPLDITQWDFITLDNPILEIYIVGNEPSGRFVGTFSIAEAMNTYNTIAMIEREIMPINVMLAHELGHILYLLPDWTKVDNAYCHYHVDIMCYPSSPFEQRILGMKTSRFIGKEVYSVHLPMIRK